mmetsp:Transcript_22234/g.40934  ORF Transcript_22234/g.40934 Transcript_22234/m.40934 type:complete len:94 (-) Transcript_22234:50-331(-)
MSSKDAAQQQTPADLLRPELPAVQRAGQRVLPHSACGWPAATGSAKEGKRLSGPPNQSRPAPRYEPGQPRGQQEGEGPLNSSQKNDEDSQSLQ